MIVDDLGRPMQGTAEEHAVVLDWSRLPNVFVKLSVVPDPEFYPHRDPAPVLAALFSRFGPRAPPLGR